MTTTISRPRRIAALMACIAAVAGPAHAQTPIADQATITFHGNFTCPTSGLAVAKQGGTDDGSHTVLVTLPDIPETALPDDTAIAGLTPFSLVLTGANEGKPLCNYLYTNTTLTFLNTSALIDSTTGWLKNAGTAQGVELQLLGAPVGTPGGTASNPINLTLATNVYTVPATSANGATSATPINFAVQYRGTGGPVPGTISSYVLIQIGYN